jgi:hypothetical protein
MTTVPDIARVQEIVEDAQSDAGEVNRQITTAYHQLSEAARAALGAGPNLDWCGFAKWSSHTVGFNLNPQLVGLRSDEIANRILEHLPPGLAVVRPHLIELLRSAADVEDDLVRKALRGGNAMIFREMGSIFVRLVDRLSSAEARDATNDDRFAGEIISAMQAGAPKFLRHPISPELFVDAEESVLADAIRFYLRAAREPGHRAELMLAGNMLFSVYEQRRADRLIAIGTCAPVRARIVDVLRRLKRLDEKAAERILLAPRGGPDPAAGGLVKDLATPFVVGAEEAVAALLTEQALVVEIAGERIRLGDPDALTPQIVPTLPEVAAVLDAQASHGPRTWLDLRYRLSFIARYFAAHQQKAAATAEPALPA